MTDWGSTNEKAAVPELCAPAGNAALAGASRAITDLSFRKSLVELARKCEYVALAADEGFKKLFIRHIDFGGVN